MQRVKTFEVQVSSGSTQRIQGQVALRVQRVAGDPRDAGRQDWLVPVHHCVPEQALGGVGQALVGEGQLAILTPRPSAASRHPGSEVRGQRFILPLGVSDGRSTHPVEQLTA
ncbi:hypothetical protein [Streptomyces sp. NPDC055709]